MKDFFGGVRGPALFMALSFVLIHCSPTAQDHFGLNKDAVSSKKKTSKSDHSDDGTTDDDDDTAATAPVDVKKPDPDLKFAFDSSTRALLAKVKPDLAQGTLFVRVFAIQHGIENAIDCNQVKSGGVSVDLSKAVGTGTYVSVNVPVSSANLRQLDGTTRTAIQGCVFDATGKVTQQYATSLMNAWDNADTSESASPRIFHGIEAYANGCMEELGELPMFANGDFKCDAEGMSVVPIRATDNAGNVTVLDETTTNWPLTSVQRAATQRCDNPAWLGYDGDVADAQTSQCAPFTRIGQFQNSKGTRFIFICRRETVRSLADKTFENINFVAHNPTSGKTCYFNNHLDGSVTDGTKIPRPDSPVSDKFWMDMGSIQGQRCPACHDSDPWMHSPWVDSALDKKTGHTIVPKQGEDPSYNLQTKYSIFGRESFVGTDRNSQQDWKQPQMLTDVGTCGQCHRIGTGQTMQLWTARSVGEDNEMSDFLTPAFQTNAKLHWMPEDLTATRKIENCARNPGSCAVQDVPH